MYYYNYNYFVFLCTRKMDCFRAVHVCNLSPCNMIIIQFGGCAAFECVLLMFVMQIIFFFVCQYSLISFFVLNLIYFNLWHLHKMNIIEVFVFFKYQCITHTDIYTQSASSKYCFHKCLVFVERMTANI